MSLLRWDDTPRYLQGFYIGSEDDDGNHLRHSGGWPYSIYRHSAQAGVSDVVICHGIQSLNDAQDILSQLQGLA